MVEARRVLLDVLTALANHRDAIVLIGAQAVYEHCVGLSWLPPTSTTDADLCLDPSLLAARPLLGDAMADAGFHLNNLSRPGIYARNVSVVGLSVQPTLDLLVPEAVAGKGTRSAQVGMHGKHAATRADGLEMALLDHSMKSIFPLDARATAESGADVLVAGVGALLCAKSYKLAERLDAFVSGRGRESRIRPKDAGDVLRLMAISEPAVVRGTFQHCEAHQQFGRSAEIGRGYLTRLFSTGGAGVELAVRSARSEASEAEIREVIASWMAGFV
jgi:hypothetical protein